MRTWIVVANRSEAKIFVSDPKLGREVEFHSKLENPRGRLRNGDINADKPGAFGIPGTGHGSGRERTQSPTERVAQEFAIEVVMALDAGRTSQDYEELILIADPHFLGLLRNTMTKELSKLVVQEEAKDLTLVTTDEIKARLWPEESASANASL